MEEPPAGDPLDLSLLDDMEDGDGTIIPLEDAENPRRGLWCSGNDDMGTQCPHGTSRSSAPRADHERRHLAPATRSTSNRSWSRACMSSEQRIAQVAGGERDGLLALHEAMLKRRDYVMFSNQHFSRSVSITSAREGRRGARTLGLMLTALSLAGTASAARPLPPPGQGEPEIDPVDPSTQSPAAPSGISVGTRTATTVALSFRDSSRYETGYQLQRRAEGSSSWVTRRSFGALSSTATASFTDSGLTPDTPYCYRVRAYNQNGQRYSPERCVFSRDGQGFRVWRAQLEVRVADRGDANTDDPVFARLNGGAVPSGNITYMDYGRDDFERGSTFRYDLNLDSIDDIGDITQITLSKDGDDALCVQGFSLLVNGIEVFDRDFGAASSCHWLDTGGGYSPTLTVSHAALRAHPAWAGYNHTAAQFLLAFGIRNEELVSRVEALIGDSLHGEDLHWGHLYGPAVEISRGCPASEAECTRAHVDLDLAYATWLPDPEVDVDFDLDFVCADGALGIVTSNLEVDADSDWYYEILGLGLLEILDYKVRRGVEAAWEDISQELDVGAECRVNVTPDGGLSIEAAPSSGGLHMQPGLEVLEGAVNSLGVRP
ncbi:fibronectin type III domain-containing protein [Sorangium sp. So ce590]|uniref:fibronectin type III domain-containing protein n=1 Tax=Sorangium sp. So ce590 TaxID=3133317 RepID=UPI003F5EC692